MEDVKFVINYDYPNSSEDYIYSTAEELLAVPKQAHSIHFFTPNNIKAGATLSSVLREANQAINPKLHQLVEDRGSGRSRRGMKG